MTTVFNPDGAIIGDPPLPGSQLDTRPAVGRCAIRTVDVKVVSAETEELVVSWHLAQPHVLPLSPEFTSRGEGFADRVKGTCFDRSTTSPGARAQRYHGIAIHAEFVGVDCDPSSCSSSPPTPSLLLSPYNIHPFQQM